MSRFRSPGAPSPARRSAGGCSLSVEALPEEQPRAACSHCANSVGTNQRWQALGRTLGMITSWGKNGLCACAEINGQVNLLRAFAP